MFGLTLPEYERRCKAAFQQCGLGLLRLTPHTARHGGPSTDAALGLRSEDQIQSRGRWKARKSVLRYMKQGRLMRQIGKLTPAQLQKYKRVSTTLFRKFERLLRPVPSQTRPCSHALAEPQVYGIWELAA